MAAKTEVKQAGSILTETAGTTLVITRTVHTGDQGVPVVKFNVRMEYAEAEYLIDAEGNRIRLLSSNMNPKQVYHADDASMEFYMTPMKTADGEDTVLGEFLSQLWDQDIVADMQKPNTNPVGIPL